MRAWFLTTARAIAADGALRAYAVILSALHALTGVAWFTYKHIATLATDEDSVCWPLFPDCDRVRSHLTASGVRDAVVLYCALGVLAAILFARRRCGPALALFLAASVLGTLLYALDYRLRLNQTYMFGWVVLAFLFAPDKRQVTALLVALFYFWAGTLKLNREWVSGAALYARPLFVPESLLPLACVYVLLLELVVVWGLFAPSARVRWCVYAQLLLFHAVSWPVVGYFYPLLMLGLTAIYPLTWLRERGGVARVGWMSRAPAVVAALFSGAQLVPYLFPGDSAITGEGRTFALHMFDARVECRGGAILRAPSSARSRALLINDRLEPRLRCDPIVLFAEATRLCRLLAARPEPPAVDVAIDAKRSSDDAMQPLLHIGDFCVQPLAYSPWHHNVWIGAPDGVAAGPRTRTEKTPATTNSAMNGE